MYTASHPSHSPVNQFHEKQLAICVVSGNTIWVKSYAFAAPRFRKDHPASFPLSYRRICTGKGCPEQPGAYQTGSRLQFRTTPGIPSLPGRNHLY
jgi:hypothetical protein